MFTRLIALLIGTVVFAEAPRPRPGFEGVGVRFSTIQASGDGSAEDDATGFEVTGNFPLRKAGAWQYDWGFRVCPDPPRLGRGPRRFRSCPGGLP